MTCSRFLLVLSLMVAGGCGTLKRAALKSVADTFAADRAGGVYAEDDDPELVRDALPFALKAHEMILAEYPRHRGLLQATAAGFIQYAHAFVHEEAERQEEEDLQRARQLRARAVRLYLRGRDYALQSLELKYPGFRYRLDETPKALMADMTPADVPLLYWAGAGWGGALAADSSNMAMVGDLPKVERLMRRALALEPDYDHGALHEFFITYEGGRSEAMGGRSERAKAHFTRAVALTKGAKASPYVAYAASVAVQKQDAGLFVDLLNKALAVDVDSRPEWRLANVLSQEKARWLLDHGPDLFIDFQPQEP